MGEGVDAALSMSVSMSLLAEGELASAPANVCVKESSARRVRFALWLSCASRSGSSRDRLLRGRSMSIMLAVAEGARGVMNVSGVEGRVFGEGGIEASGIVGGSERCGGDGGGRTLARERWFQFWRAQFRSVCQVSTLTTFRSVSARAMARQRRLSLEPQSSGKYEYPMMLK